MDATPTPAGRSDLTAAPWVEADGPTGGRWKRALFGAALVWAGVTALRSIVGIVSQLLRPKHGIIGSTPGWFYRLFFHWDSAYFADIARNGYFGTGSKQQLQAFFPGYPLTIRAVTFLLGTGHPGSVAVSASMWLISMVASLAAGVLLWRLAADQFNDRVALLATILLLAGPYGVFLGASYSEPLFLAFGVGAWWSATRHRWLLAGLLCAAASLTRVNGLFLSAALLVMYLVDHRRSGGRWFRPSLAAVLLAPLGAVLYWGYLTARTGSLTAWQSAEAIGWHRQTQWPWLTFYQTTHRLMHAATLDRRIQAGFDIAFAFFGLVGLWWSARHRLWPEVVLVGLTLSSLMTSFTYDSLARNTLTLFPLIIPLAAGLVRTRQRWFRPVFLTIAAALMLFNTVLSALGLWAD